jgi:hypothetical protein
VLIGAMVNPVYVYNPYKKSKNVKNETDQLEDPSSPGLRKKSLLH